MARGRATDRGTPCAPAWTKEWVALVNQTETELDRRICGAVAMDGSPCPRASNHPTGRCTHHGGNHLVGGQTGNENARIHGLYSRRLLTCDTRCLLWQECPFAAEDIMDLPPKQRPKCVYETLEYDTLIEHYTPAPQPQSDPFAIPAPEPPRPDPHLVHTTALLQVMMSRAAAVLSARPLTETTRASSQRYSMESSKVSAALDAFLRLAREHRHYRRLLDQSLDHAPKPKPMGLPSLMRPILKQGEGVLEQALEYEQKRRKKLRETKPSSSPGGSVSEIPADEQERDQFQLDAEVGEEGKQRVAAFERPSGEGEGEGEGEGGLPHAPANVQASDGAFSDRVRVTWNAVPGASEYKVHRSETDNAGTARLLSTVAATRYDDKDARAPTTPTTRLCLKIRNGARIPDFAHPKHTHLRAFWAPTDPGNGAQNDFSDRT